ncbi:protein FAM151B isoform X2 [Motacilla alba alba]|uniref:protein FAM151B isoform X2 n=1 Tax=Motacilla alba alba TaxID=1094192 RepID=UPI0018D57916|nr:protein FAM151B isoform X2 [Motacilla alba alba]
MASAARGAWSEWPVDHFLRCGRIAARDGAAVRWFHAANSSARAAEAARSDVHMVEVDVVLRGGDGEPILAHPPDTDSDITLQEWLAQMGSTNKGIKLDFKRGSRRMAAGVARGCGDTAVTLPSLTLPRVPAQPGRRGTLSGAAGAGGAGPGQTRVAERGHPARARRELRAAGRPRLPARRHLLLPRCHPVPGLDHRLPPRARFSLTVWTGKEDVYSVEDLLLIRENFDKSRVYYDIFEPQNSEFRKAIGIEQ